MASKRFFLITACTVIICAASGCSPTIVPPGDDVVKGLSALVLDPTKGCEELRNAFGLDYLPVVQTPAEAGIAYEEHFVATPDQAILHVWYLPTNLNRGTVILSIGSSSAMNCYLFVARLLTRNGWSVVIYEYQGYGLSSGVASLTTLASDLETVLDWTLATTGRESVTLAGISLGTVPSVEIAARRPESVNGLILDSPVALGEELLRFDLLLRGEAPTYIARLAPELVSEERIRDVPQPLLVFLHELDTLTTPRQTELLYDRAPGEKLLVRFSNLTHANGPYFSTDVYTYHTDTFLTSIWATP